MSTEFWKNNIDALRLHYNQIADYMTKYNPDDDEDEVIVGVDEACGKKVLFVVKDEMVIQLDSLYDETDMLDMWLEDAGCENILFAKTLMYGFGNGMYARHFLNNMPTDRTIIVYEPSAKVFYTVLNEFDISDILSDERLTLLLSDTCTGKIQEYYYNLMDYMDVNSFKYYTYLNYNLIFEEQFYAYMEGVQTAVSAINSTQSVIGRFGSQYNINTFENLKYLISSKSIESLYRNMPKDIPAIVVSAGPSLDKNIDKLKEAVGRALIISVDSALRPLNRAGIIPDICITLDGKKNPKHFENPESLDIPLVCMLQCNHRILDSHHANKYFLNDMNHHVQHFMSAHNLVLPVTSSGGSVANDAFSLARMLGLETIILVGQDLAYTDNRTHSVASVRGEKNMDVNSFTNNEWVEGIDGERILSSGEFVLYRAWFEEQIAAHPSMRVIDATEGGAKIAGSVIMTLEEAIRTECTRDFDFKSVEAQSLDFFTEEQKSDFTDYLLKLPEELTEALKQVKEGEKCYERMLSLIYKDKYHSNEMKKISNRLSEITDYLDRAPAMEYVQNDLQLTTTEMLADIYRTEDNERKELIAVSNRGMEYLKKMEEILGMVIEAAGDKVNTINSQG